MGLNKGLDKGLDKSLDKRLDKKAVALKYEHVGAPKVVAKGEGIIAKHILELAEEVGIPIQHDKDLVSSLIKVELNQEIPPELYTVVAELLAFIYRLEKKNNILKGKK